MAVVRYCETLLYHSNARGSAQVVGMRCDSEVCSDDEVEEPRHCLAWEVASARSVMMLVCHDVGRM